MKARQILAKINNSESALQELVNNRTVTVMPQYADLNGVIVSNAQPI